MSTKSTPNEKQQRARKLAADRQRKFKATHKAVLKEQDKGNRIRFRLDRPFAEAFLALCQHFGSKPGATIDWLVAKQTENGCFFMPRPWVETEIHSTKVPVDTIVDEHTKVHLKAIAMKGNPQFLAWSLGEIIECLILPWLDLKDGVFTLRTGTANPPAIDSLTVLHGAQKGQKHAMRVQLREDIKERWTAKEADKRARKQGAIDKALAKRDHRLDRELRQVILDSKTEWVDA